MQETQVQSLSWEDPLEKEMATHSITLAWTVLQMEEPAKSRTWLSVFTSLHYNYTFKELHYHTVCLSLVIRETLYQSITIIKNLSVSNPVDEYDCNVAVQVLSHIKLFATPKIAPPQAPLSSTISKRWLQFMSTAI